VFFVHNRIETIHRIDALVATLVPEARRAVVHGQMPRHELEDSMMAFVRGEIDVLVATTIVESGLDIPNANTLIVDRAHRIGLADLHQLRGRVGRGRHRGHALFLLPEEHKVTDEVAERRLRTIEEHSGLGAGFRIALKDLEIRGAGNLLGAEQSGYIADVGYELYCRLLEDAVKGLKNERVTEATDTYVDLHVAAGVPDSYVGDPSLKLGFYRRIASVATAADLLALRSEIVDRCGPLPETGERLFDVARLRILGQEHGIARFSMEKGGTLQMTMLDPVRALPFLRARLGRSLRLPEPPLAIVAEPVKPAVPQRALARFLELLAPAGA
ncbi:MAG: TRCF domain-containing protein, partial [Planctomycetota bacterium]